MSRKSRKDRILTWTPLQVAIAAKLQEGILGVVIAKTLGCTSASVTDVKNALKRGQQPRATPGEVAAEEAVAKQRPESSLLELRLADLKVRELDLSTRELELAFRTTALELREKELTQAETRRQDDRQIRLDAIRSLQAIAQRI